jgi:hypothetical protein
MNWLQAAVAKSSSATLIYILFKRPNVFYKDTYLVFVGTLDELNAAMQDMAAQVLCPSSGQVLCPSSGQVLSPHARGDHDHLDDTPLNTFCDKTCYRTAMTKAYADVCGTTADVIPLVVRCPDDYGNFCASRWDVFSFVTLEELQARIQLIPEETHYYGHFDLEYLTKTSFAKTC